MNPFREHVPIRRNPSLVDRIRRDYNAGMTVVEIAAKRDLSRLTIRKVLDEEIAGCNIQPVTIRRRGRRSKSGNV